MARYDFFISHHQADTGAEASLLAETLRNQGYRVFLDVDTHQVGDLEHLTREALNASKGVLVLVGPNFAKRLRSERDWVRLELEAAKREKKKILPIVLPDAAGNLDELPASLAWVGRTRWLSFDRARVGSLVEEVTSAFAVRARASSGPGIGYLVLMIVLALLLGMSFLDGQKKDTALELQRARLEAEKSRADALQRELERIKSNGQRQ